MDINGNLRFLAGEFQNFYLEELAADPSFSASEQGRLYFNTTSFTIRLNNGSAWVTLSIGTPSLSSLTDVTIAGVANNDFLVYTGAGWENRTPTQARTHLGLGTFATENLSAVPAMTLAGDIAAGGTYTITGLRAPSLDSDAATKLYVDQSVSGLRDFKDSVRAATTANITLSGTQTIDGVAVIAGNRVLVKNQSDASDNGIYVVAAGAWSRATDFDSDADVTSGSFVFVTEGTANGNTGWVLGTDDPITLDVTNLTFVQFSNTDTIYTAGSGIDIVGNVVSIETGGVTNAMLTNSTITIDGVSVALGASLNLTSTDSSVTISSNNTTKEIDLSVTVTSTLDDLTDVAITTPSTGHTIRYNGSSWVNAFLVINDLSDVIITTAVSGHALRYNGANWVNQKVTHLYESSVSSTSHAITHNLNSTRPVVTVYDQSSGAVMIPSAITINSANQLTVTLASASHVDVAISKV